VCAGEIFFDLLEFAVLGDDFAEFGVNECFQFAEECGLPERERKASQLIERGVHQFALV
jgi:hypothetical protein